MTGDRAQMDDLSGSVADRLEQLAIAEQSGWLTISWLTRQLIAVLNEVDTIEPELERELERHEDF